MSAVMPAVPDVSDRESIPLSKAHTRIDVPRATIYRWHKEGKLFTWEEITPGGGWIICTTIRHVKEVRDTMRRKRGQRLRL